MLLSFFRRDLDVFRSEQLLVENAVTPHSAVQLQDLIGGLFSDGTLEPIG